MDVFSLFSDDPSFVQKLCMQPKTAFAYTCEQWAWYSNHASRNWFLFRLAGICAIVSGIAITYLSATLKSRQTIWRFDTTNLIAGLALIGVVSVSLSDFFGWRSSWESYRLAQIELEALIVEADARERKLENAKSSSTETQLRLEITKRTRDIVLTETNRYYTKIPDSPPSPGGK